MSGDIYTFKVLRYDAQKPEEKATFSSYSVRVIPGLTVLTVLMRIRDELDGTLAFRSSCRAATCGSCAMVINGRLDLACRTQVTSCNSETIILEPLPNFEIIRDLVVDLTPFWTMYERVKPYLVRRSPDPGEGDPPERRRQEADRPVRQLHTLRLLLRGVRSAETGA